MDTDEDFFAGRRSLAEILNGYNDLPAEQVIVHWYSPMPPTTSESDTGMIIPAHFSTYYLDESDLKRVKVGRIRFAEGDRYVVHLIDGRYNRVDVSSNKAREIFETPLTV
ncbi:hypothetical protein, partial [Parapedobacter sp. 10938]|uniref:hypothetical protein n=1 Tax=Parapedobacter flavus TaxID=3110225 RepID=UPI002DB9119D